MNNATLEKIFRYPIKSMMGESLQFAKTTWKGIVGIGPRRCAKTLQACSM